MGENLTTQNVNETLDEYEYFEEEVVSQYEYETMLSTILEGDYESCSSQKSNTSKPVNMRIEINVPQNISLTPTDQRPPQESSKLWALLSPMMFSPISDARKLKIFSQKTPLVDVKQNPSAVASSTRPETHSSTIQGTPLVLTSLESGEEIVVMDGYDDEYTFVSCDTEATIRELVPQSTNNQCTNLESAPPDDESEFITGWSYVPKSPPEKALDFDATRLQLENAFGSRLKL